MPNTRVFLPAAPSSTKVFLRARLYAASAPAPQLPTVHTRCQTTDPQDLRFPCVESILDCGGVQPHVHDIIVVLKHGRRTTRFRVFFKRHVRLPLNPHANLQGDILIMRMASSNPHSVVNLRSGDTRLADFVLRKISHRLRDFQGPERLRLPLQLSIARRW
ncbi:hypothetical protein DFH06DRAFT_1329224 [Mycena polygramma]|nr:hypothetical protein DFH06DRAFT_1329224 [Mycena polygramma]